MLSFVPPSYTAAPGSPALHSLRGPPVLHLESWCLRSTLSLPRVKVQVRSIIVVTIWLLTSGQVAGPRIEAPSRVHPGSPPAREREGVSSEPARIRATLLARVQPVSQCRAPSPPYLDWSFTSILGRSVAAEGDSLGMGVVLTARVVISESESPESCIPAVQQCSE
jgi:hypothetical protein